MMMQSKAQPADEAEMDRVADHKSVPAIPPVQVIVRRKRKRGGEGGHSQCQQGVFKREHGSGSVPAGYDRAGIGGCIPLA